MPRNEMRFKQAERYPQRCQTNDQIFLRTLVFLSYLFLKRRIAENEINMNFVLFNMLTAILTANNINEIGTLKPLEICLYLYCAQT